MCRRGGSCLRCNGWIRPTVSALGCWCKFSPNGSRMMLITVYYSLYCPLKKLSSVCAPSQIVSQLDVLFLRSFCRESLVWMCPRWGRALSASQLRPSAVGTVFSCVPSPHHWGLLAGHWCCLCRICCASSVDFFSWLLKQSAYLRTEKEE